jgi:DNA repair ATPase RecN
MIYATIPSKYLNDDLAEILNDLKTLYTVLFKFNKMRESLSDKLLECENDGQAYEIGQCINMLSSNIKYITENVDNIKEIICEEEHITLEEFSKMIMKIKFRTIEICTDELIELPNKLSQNIFNRVSKRYNLKINYLEVTADGRCPIDY